MVLIYGLYRESLKENYGLDNLLRWLMRDEGKAGEASDEREKDPLRSPLDRNDSSWEPDSTMDVFREEKSLETEKRPRTNENLSASKTTNKGNTWGIKTVVFKIVECLLLIPLFLAGVWLWKGDAASLVFDWRRYLGGSRSYYSCGNWLYIGNRKRDCCTKNKDF